MCKFNPKNDARRMDPCMKKLIENLKLYTHLDLKSCCCGHGRYPMTIVVKFDGEIFDLVSDIEIPRKKKFYKKDGDGYYYIPEISEPKRLPTTSRRIYR